ncbi:MAG: ribosome small subunit-dependent GTPase A [Microbacteriaceae bacterium]|nr:ribosome small subunit-dependent GTPase A [Microbacteriaceae bacterium]
MTSRNWQNGSGAYDRYEHYSEKVRVRPNPKANRPRTKRRPEHSDAVLGKIIAVDRGRYTAIIDAGVSSERTVTASRARELHKTAIVVGDIAQLVGDTSGNAGTLARIVGLSERRTVLRRSADDTDRLERVMVANADQMLIVVAAADPEPRVRMVDRALVAAYHAGITPLLCVTKTDLADPAEFLQHFAALDVPVFLSAQNAWPIAELSAQLAGKTTVFMGHSGVGKSTLINALVPEANRATGHVNEVTGRGRHTSSSSVALRLPALQSTGEEQIETWDEQTETGKKISTLQTISETDKKPTLQINKNAASWVIDTPGVRSFGLGHVTAKNVISGFTDLAEIIAKCPRGCDHGAASPDCELTIAEAENTLEQAQQARLDSLRRLLATADTHDRQ